MYQAVLDLDIVPHSIYLWKLKLPLKVKVFLWLLFRRVILTKDNLVKRNWHGDTKCCFCNNHETIQHLFVDCMMAMFIWWVIHLTFGIGPPVSINQMFGNWVINMKRSLRNLFLVGIGAMLWAIWLSRNDIIFNKSPGLSYMQVIFRGTHWTRVWSAFQKENERRVLQNACRLLETLQWKFLPSMDGSLVID
jgi:hypothetical protein